MTHVQSIERLDVRSACPTITYGVSATVDGQHPGRRALIVEFSGQYRDGPLGNMDAHFIRGVIELVSEMWQHSSLVIDLSGLNYQRGDMIDFCLVSPRDKPVAVVVGPGCDHSLGRIWFGDVDGQCESANDGVFHSLAAALNHLSGSEACRPRTRGH
ncbi:hypothetical protein [Dyella amyloliquefaciens]|uniref:hypothetical protein n=1 Tax=Dyella amyloliquefaciens TaxID=1770545 RepID=UPI00102E3671|nr:hypothetical protein [Dyella amyloliquefaciens]